MFRLMLPALVLSLALPMLTGCGPFSDAPLVGADGNPRFNLYFTNEEQVDMDLHVIDPGGEEVYWNNTSSASGGNLDVDCLCTRCSQGPSENIYWPDGAAPTGTYTFWAQYYGACDGNEGASSEFFVRVVRNGTVLNSYQGSMSANGESTRWTFDQ